MESLEPVSPPAKGAGGSSAAATEGPQTKGAAVVQAAEAQVTELQRRLEATSELVQAAEDEAASARQAVAARESEIARLVEAQGAGEAAAERREQMAQLNFLNQQVDFLNDWRSALDAELRGEREARQQADARRGEAERVAQASAEEARALQAQLVQQERQLELERLEMRMAVKEEGRLARDVQARPWKSKPQAARGGEAKQRPSDSTPRSLVGAARRAWLAETEVAMLRVRLEEGREDAARAAEGRGGGGDLQQQLEQVHTSLRAERPVHCPTV